MACSDRLARDLRAKGFRVTPQRAVILEVIAHRGGHQSAKDVYREARGRLPGLNLVTVYRTLENLLQAGMLDLFSVAGGVDRFGLREATNPHGHLVCRRCGDVREFPAEEVARFATRLSRRHSFRVEASHLTLQGLCERCQSQVSGSRMTARGPK